MNRTNEASRSSKPQPPSKSKGWSVVIPTWDLERALIAAGKLCQYGRPEHVIIVYSGPTLYTAEQVALLMRKHGELAEGIPMLEVHMCVDVQVGSLLLPVKAMAVGAMIAIENCAAEKLLFLHDDVHVLGPWSEYLDDALARGAGLVGFGGRRGFGTWDIYRSPYRLDQLVGIDFLSNMDNWSEHGRKLNVPQRVAYLDGFSLALSVDVYKYESVGTWEACLLDEIEFHMYDAWISLEAARKGLEVWAVPVLCHHFGGSTSVGMRTEYEHAVRAAGYAHGQELFDIAHRRIYNLFPDVLPIPPYALEDGNG